MLNDQKMNIIWLRYHLIQAKHRLNDSNHSSTILRHIGKTFHYSINQVVASNNKSFFVLE